MYYHKKNKRNTSYTYFCFAKKCWNNFDTLMWKKVEKHFDTLLWKKEKKRLQKFIYFTSHFDVKLNQNGFLILMHLVYRFYILYFDAPGVLFLCEHCYVSIYPWTCINVPLDTSFVPMDRYPCTSGYVHMYLWICTHVPLDMYPCTSGYVPMYLWICTHVPLRMYPQKTQPILKKHNQFWKLVVFFFKIGCVFFKIGCVFCGYMSMGTWVHAHGYMGTCSWVHGYMFRGTWVHVQGYIGTCPGVHGYITQAHTTDTHTYICIIVSYKLRSET